MDNYTNILDFDLIDRGYTGHEHLDEFGLINMNGRLYDPVLGRMLSPDPYVQSPDFAQNFNRYSYCVNNPLKYTDPTGEFFWIPIIAGAVLYGTANTIIHHNRGDIHNFWDGLGYFMQGAVVGAVAGASWSLGIGGITSVNPLAQLGGGIIMGAKTISAINTITSGIKDFENAGKIIMGRAYTDENRSFFGGIWQGISRNTVEGFQTWVGYNVSQIRNTYGKVDHVEYFGGATFSIGTNTKKRRGVSLGNYINVWFRRDLNHRNFDDEILSDPLYMHEYGHTFDSQLYMCLYLPIIGPVSAAANDGDNTWTEIRANIYAKNYFKKFGVDWDNTPWRGGVIEDDYRTYKR